MRRWRKLLSGPALAISLSLLMILGPAAGAENGHAASADTITAVVLRSWDCDQTGGGWTYVNENWPSLGSIPVSVDFSDPSLCGTTITYEALVASGAESWLSATRAGRR